MTRRSNLDWHIPAALIAISIVPVIAGATRLVWLTIGDSVTLDNARFFAQPLPVVLHIVSAGVFCVLGASQFAPNFRLRKPHWHRRAGQLLAICGLITALSGLWMTRLYPRTYVDGELIYGIRLLFGSAMVIAIVLGTIAIVRRNIPQHRAWMIRGYAIGIGAGTQFFMIVLWTLCFGPPIGFSHDLLMGAAWIINLVFAERIVDRQRVQPIHPPALAEQFTVALK
jgi:hypothetical protein